MRLKPGAARSVNVRFRVPSQPAAGPYYLLARLSPPGAGGAGSGSGGSVAASAGTISVEAPFIDLTGSFVSTPASVAGPKGDSRA